MHGPQDLYESFTCDTLNRLTGATLYDATTDADCCLSRYFTAGFSDCLTAAR